MQNTRMPVLFVGHGNPMNAIEDNEFSQAWTRIGAKVCQHPAQFSVFQPTGRLTAHKLLPC